MYSFKNSVKYSEIGENKHLPLYQIVNYFQNCTSMHSDSLGATMEFYKNLAWILASWQIVINDYPKIDDVLTTSTWAHSFKGITAGRNFKMTGDKGQVFAYANSIWSFVDTTTGHPIKIRKEEAEIYGIEEPLEMEYAPRKIHLSVPLSTVDTLPVRHFQIDPHKHMNNSQYVLICEEYLPSTFITGSLRVEYRRSALLGNLITVRQAYIDTEHTYLFELQNEENEILALLEFKEKM